MSFGDYQLNHCSLASWEQSSESCPHQKIGLDGSAGLETVAPGIGGALVAAAFNLFAAVLRLP